MTPNDDPAENPNGENNTSPDESPDNGVEGAANGTAANPSASADDTPYSESAEGGAVDPVLSETGGAPSENDAEPGERSADNRSADELRAALEAAESRAEANWERLLRLQAEMENQRKRAQKEVLNARKFALEGLVGDLLPIRDSLELGMQAAEAEEADVASIRTGSELTLKMLIQALEKYNVVEINPLDEKFDPEFHQAMSMQEVEGKAPNTVTAVMQKGYTLNERLIRPALVMVAR